MPSRAPRRCNKCAAMAVADGRCADHPLIPWENPSANTRALTGAQRAAFRSKVLAKDGYTCRHCGAPATEADHIIEIADGGAPTDWEGNGQALCTSCHTAKTQSVRAARRRRQVGF